MLYFVQSIQAYENKIMSKRVKSVTSVYYGTGNKMNAMSLRAFKLPV